MSELGSLPECRASVNGPRIAAIHSLSRAVSAADPDPAVPDQSYERPLPPKTASRLSGSSPDPVDDGNGVESLRSALRYETSASGGIKSYRLRIGSEIKAKEAALLTLHPACL